MLMMLDRSRVKSAFRDFVVHVLQYFHSMFGPHGVISWSKIVRTFSFPPFRFCVVLESETYAIAIRILILVFVASLGFGFAPWGAREAL